MRYVTIHARNIANLSALDSRLEQFSKRTTHNNVKKWIKGQLRNWFINKYDRVSQLTDKNSKLLNVLYKNKIPKWIEKALDNNENVYFLVFERSQVLAKINHTIDFLNTLPETRNINYSVEDAFRATEVWDEQRRRAAEKEGLQKIINKEEDGIEEIHKYNNGFKWISVFGKESLDREGKLMDHCVGSYYDRVKNNETKIYSLRDTDNMPHCTIELTNSEIKQIKGRKNGIINEKYLKYIEDFINKKYIKFRSVSTYDLFVNGLVIANNHLYTFDNAPDNIIINSNLYLDVTNIKRLPNGLTVDGSLYLPKTIKYMPDNLTVLGELGIIGVQATKLGKNTNVQNLTIGDSNFTELPDDLVVSGDLDIRGSNIKKIPRLELKNLFAQKSKLETLPEGFKADTIDISYTQVRSLPSDLEVNDLNIEGTDIDTLPNIKIKDRLRIGDKIEKIPDNFQIGRLTLFNRVIDVGKNVSIGSLTLNNVAGKIGEFLHIKDYLSLIDCNKLKLPKAILTDPECNCSLSKLIMTEFPAISIENMTIQDCIILSLKKVRCSRLHIKDSDVTTFPLNTKKLERLKFDRVKNLTIPKNLNLQRLVIYECPDITEIEGIAADVIHILPEQNITIKNCKCKLLDAQRISIEIDSIKALTLDLEYADISSLPDNLTLDSLLLHGSSIEKLPNRLKVHKLHITDTIINDLPKDLEADYIYIYPRQMTKFQAYAQKYEFVFSDD